MTAEGGSLLETVQERGTLNCGVSGAAVAFSTLDPSGNMVGFDADFCRAVAAAVLGDAEAVNFVALTAAERFTAVQSGDIDVLMRNTTWTQSRDTDVGMDFGPTTYYDGQQLMGKASDGFSGSSTVADLDGATICTNAGTTTEKNIGDAGKQQVSQSIFKHMKISISLPTTLSLAHVMSSQQTALPSLDEKPSNNLKVKNG